MTGPLTFAPALPTLPSPQPTTATSDPHLSGQIREACQAWLSKSPSRDTRANYARDLAQFLAFAGIAEGQAERLVTIRPHHVAAWRDHLKEAGLTSSSVRRKMTVLRSLFSYLQTYGYTGANPAHGDFVEARPVPRDGKTGRPVARGSSPLARRSAGFNTRRSP